MEQEAPRPSSPFGPAEAVPFCIASSPKVGTLFSALARAQGKFKIVKKTKLARIKGRSKDGSDTEFSYHYADLADILEAVTPALSEEGLSLIQPVRMSSGIGQITTILVHGESEQWVSEVYDVPAYPTPREQGSAITYARRYSVGCILGLSPDEDDDGKAAQDSKPEKQQRKDKGPEKPKEELVSPEEAKSVRDGLLALFHDKKGEERASACVAFLKSHGYEQTKDIPKAKLSEVLDAIQAKIKSQAEPEPVDGTVAGGDEREPGSDG